jgi:ATP-dependent DNA helicase RecQ
MDSGDFSSRISEVLKKFESVSGLSFKLKKEQDTAVKNLLSNRDVLAVLPTGYGKSLIFQTYVMAAQSINKMNACILVICPLTSIIEDQIAEARSLGIKCVTLLEISLLELKQSAFDIVFSSAERVMEKEFKNILKDSSSLLHKNVCGIVVDESHTVETWTGKRFVRTLLTATGRAPVIALSNIKLPVKFNWLIVFLWFPGWK